MRCVLCTSIEKDKRKETTRKQNKKRHQETRNGGRKKMEKEIKKLSGLQSNEKKIHLISYFLEKTIIGCCVGN